MKTYVEFKSNKFRPYEGEEDQVNPGRWGKRLAEFLADGLRAKGIAVRDMVPEDWGWVVRIVNGEFPLWIGCGNYDEYHEGYLCFVEPSKPFIRRFFKKVSTVDVVQSLVVAVESTLSSEPGIRDIRWWTAEEFNDLAQV